MSHAKQEKESTTQPTIPVPTSSSTTFSRLEAAFGKHNLGDISISRSMDVSHLENAAVRGNSIALAPSANLRTVGHEAAHIMQQRSGIEK